MSIPAGYKCNQWGLFYKEVDNSGPYYLDANGVMCQGFPNKFYTDANGDYARLRVDPGQTSFWSGKQFRTFQKFEIQSLASVTVRATVANNIVLYGTSLTVDGAPVEMILYVGGTAAGPWTPMPVLPKNTMVGTPVTISGVTLDHDGAHSGGTMIDLLRVPAGNKSAGFGAESSERGVGPGTYYYEITNTGNQPATVVFEGWWEERI